MFVGDSITIGSAGDFTWRYRLWQHLRRTRHAPFRITGPRTLLHEDSAAYADPAFPEDARGHLAGWGEGWLHMAPLIGDTVRAHRADTLLVALGLIDLGFYTNAEQTAANVHRFLDEARAAAPHLRVAILPILPNIRQQQNPEFAEECAYFNQLLAKAVADRPTPASPLLLATPPEDWDVARDTHDGTHPSASGEHRIAAAFATALHQGWEIGGPYRPVEAPHKYNCLLQPAQ
nr:GDSL-type esterase/lipase family protein [Streptomyces sp. HNM0574]